MPRTLPPTTLILACSVVLLGGGCRSGLWNSGGAAAVAPSIAGAPSVGSTASLAPPSTPSISFDSSTSQSGPIVESAIPPAANVAGTTTTPPAGTATTHEQAYQQVMGELRELGMQDPIAMQQLLQQLEGVQPALWAVTVKQYKATWEYRRQLAAQSVAKAEATRAIPVVHSLPTPASSAMPVGPATTCPPGCTCPLHTSTPGSNPAALPSPAGTPPPSTPLDRSAANQPSANRSAYSVQAASFASPASDKSPAGSAVDPPASGLLDWREKLDATIVELEKHQSASPKSTDEAYLHARTKLLQLVANQDEQAYTPVPGLSPTEQNYWSEQLFAIGTLLDCGGVRDDAQRASRALEHLEHATQNLAEVADLQVQHLTFCKEVYGYGDCEPIDAEAFSPGQQIAVYAEVKHYRSVPHDRGFHTSLGTSYEVVDLNGTRVDSGEFAVVDDYCLRRRNDFYIEYTLKLPTAIYPGKYKLRLAIRDRLSNKIGHSTIDFTIRDK